ncbi:ATP-binding domain-containing protein [Vibrio atlanticus]|uniref:UvrD/REP helicase n=1 Tax=Vibrio atlanticus TaxID=693153 RepID=A0A1C3IQE0_9VIBR|nr:ATP-binding domain-containing protein [Vibrio atlanticus]SBS63548.1 UvrD/REP helicase [Vibrio atlanticus]
MANDTYNLDDALKQLSEEALDTLEEVFLTVSEKSSKQSSDPLAHDDVFASGNSVTSTVAYDNFRKIREDSIDVFDNLKKEPFISKVVFEDEVGDCHSRYIARVSIAGVSIKARNLISKRHPLSSLASVPVGECKNLYFDGRNQELTVVEVTLFTPEHRDSWDSIFSIYKHEDAGTKEIKSLRSFLQSSVLTDDVDGFDALFEDEDEDDVIVEDGISHKVLTAMGLRDQPILDQIQDEIFRQPLNTQRVILGPPGTGKTTTLIQRLGQKRDVEFLDDLDKKIAVADFSGRQHQDSWIMFTPTELLKHYVKEAFARENVPATEDKIKTWEAHSKYIARNLFGLLQTGSDSGKFILKSDLELLSQEGVSNSVAWFEDFKNTHFSRLYSQLSEGVTLLEATANYEASEIVAKVRKALDGGSSESLVNLYEKLLPLETEITKLINAEKDRVEGKLKETLRPIYKKDKEVLGKLADFLNSIASHTEGEDDESFDDEPIEMSSIYKYTTKAASDEYIKALKALARQTYLKRTLGKSSRAKAIIDWLGEQVPSKETLIEVGRIVAFQNGLRRFVGAHRRYLIDVAANYKYFRKESFKSCNHYDELPNESKYISSDELDGVLLLTLESVHRLLASRAIRLQLDQSSFSKLNLFSSTLNNQVLVDEATDFSLIQLACMRRLCHPDTQSFFACGDFNQRIVASGVNEQEQLNWLFDKDCIQRITTVYRQSHKLNDFARQLLNVTGGDVESLGVIPDDVHHDGVPPVLIENADLEDISLWITERVNEIHALTNQKSSAVTVVPTIAVLVKDESEVEAVADDLRMLLEEINLSVEACRDGKSLGDSSGIRVFSVAHIKGLEFEAVFFVNIDELAQNSPELYEKYLYVGVTRAATYLGMACKGELPKKMDALRQHMSDSFLN